MSHVTNLERSELGPQSPHPSSHTVVEPAPHCPDLDPAPLQELMGFKSLSSAAWAALHLGHEGDPGLHGFFSSFLFFGFYYTDQPFSISTAQTSLNTRGPSSSRDKEMGRGGGKRSWGMQGSIHPSSCLCVVP